MSAVTYLLLLALLAGLVQSRVSLLDAFRGLPRFLASFGLTLFLVNWINFLLYALVGWGALYIRLSWGALLLALLYFSNAWKLLGSRGSARPAGAPPPRPAAPRPWNYWFLFLAGFVLVRFYAGLDVDRENNVWSVFSFVDTAFHLSVVNAFLSTPQFPPMDLDMAPYPLKYHFLADFHVAHLVRLGLPAISGIWLMNLISAFAMVGTLWAAFARWLRLSDRWVLLAGLIFLFLNTALVNLLHFVLLHPPFFDPASPFYGLLRFPYFNFESSLANMLEPQRGLLFSLPVVLLVLHAAFGEPAQPGAEPAERSRTMWAFVLICLLPLGHIVSFAVLVPCLLPKLWQHLSWALRRWWIWLPAFGLGVLQLLYLAVYGPPTNSSYAAWSVTGFMPLQDFAAFPPFLRQAAFWFFADGDFLFWGILFAVLAVVRRKFPARPGASTPGPWSFLVQWHWYFAICVGFFVLINLGRYSFDWGDSNKLVFFLNLGLTLVITLGVADLATRRSRLVAHLLWGFFFLLCVLPASYAFYRNVIGSDPVNGTVMIFTNNGRQAAEWIRQTLPTREIILTASNNDLHFVTPLAGRPTLAGIYGDSNPYRREKREEEIRRVYEEDALGLMRLRGVNYVCISRVERTAYRLNPRWMERMKTGQGVAFQAGEGHADYYSVYIFDLRQLGSK